MAEPAVLRVCTFAGASSLPLFIAQERGIFAAAGLSVELTTTRSSDDLMNGLIGGRFDIVHAAPDNFVAWRDRTGQPIVAWIGGSSGPLSLVAAPEIGGLADLRDRDIAVDAVASGFVSVLRKILREAGLGPTDYRLVPHGATQLRYAALLEGRTAATMLTLPWSLLAAEAGCRVLADLRAVLPRLQGSCGASLAAWLDNHVEIADTYLRSIVAALTSLYLPGFESDVRRFISARYGIEERHAEVVRSALLDPFTGWPPSAYIDPVGIDLVCDLRTENGQPPREPAIAYFTLEPYARVLGFGLLQR